MPGLIQHGMKALTFMMGDKKVKERRKGNTRWLSPRFMPIMPDKAEADYEFLSPSILSFYKDNRTIASIPDVRFFTENICFLDIRLDRYGGE